MEEDINIEDEFRYANYGFSSVKKASTSFEIDTHILKSKLIKLRQILKWRA